LFALISSLVLFTTVITASAKTGTVGVNEGDWFKYGNITADWHSNDPNAKRPPAIEAYNEIQWVTLTVEYASPASDTTIVAELKFHYKNGTETTDGGWIEIDSGNGSLTSWFISANLRAGDPIYPSGSSSPMTINETVFRNYPDGLRETNHINTNLPSNATQLGYSQDYYWDKSTGVLVENLYQDFNQTGAYTTTSLIQLKITDSKVWAVPEFPRLSSTLLILIVLTPAAVAICKRRARAGKASLRGKYRTVDFVG
jgi:hypothetical protein